MPLVFRSLLFGFLTLLVVLLIINDIAEVEKESANVGLSKKTNVHQFFPTHRNTAAHTDPTATRRITKYMDPHAPSCNNTAPKHSSSSWTFNKTLSNLIRKNILRFLDPERDISILKGTLKPGDIIHYVFDRQSTTNISENLYRLLPTASPMKNQYHRRCAIVGNSGILLNSSCGPEIDSHDFVIR
ncbi:hypothetical protein ILYODFUR_028827 [Ilyodon furcidens]|uniref:Uncharacterized protein n=1 Tax=Ilyodon furcidens TaxID=33524 RepID=A0ABV0TZ48_9TELE